MATVVRVRRELTWLSVLILAVGAFGFIGIFRDAEGSRGVDVAVFVLVSATIVCFPLWRSRTLVDAPPAADGAREETGWRLARRLAADPSVWILAGSVVILVLLPGAGAAIGGMFTGSGARFAIEAHRLARLERTRGVRVLRKPKWSSAGSLDGAYTQAAGD